MLSDYKEIRANEIPKEVLEQLKSDKKAVQGSSLYNYISFIYLKKKNLVCLIFHFSNHADD